MGATSNAILLVASNAGTGLRNYRNNCFFNATLQALFHIPSVISCMLENEHRHEDCVTCSLRDTFIQTRQWSRSIFPSHLYSLLKKEHGNLLNGHFQDAHNFLLSLLDSANTMQHTDSLIPSKFSSHIQSTTICKECGSTCSQSNEYFSIPVDIIETTHINDALKLFFEIENVDKFCEKCNKNVTAIKHFKLTSAPIVLCLQIKRFSIESKIEDCVEFGHDLTISKQMQQKESCDRGCDIKYKLMAIISHTGSLNTGHYRTITCERENSYEFNDALVTPITVMNKIKSKDAYVLFYELQKQKDLSQSEDTHNAECNKHMANEIIATDPESDHQTQNSDKGTRNAECNKHMANVMSITDEFVGTMATDTGSNLQMKPNKDNSNAKCSQHMASEYTTTGGWKEVEITDINGVDNIFEWLNGLTNDARSDNLSEGLNEDTRNAECNIHMANVSSITDELVETMAYSTDTGSNIQMEPNKDHSNAECSQHMASEYTTTGGWKEKEITDITGVDNLLEWLNGLTNDAGSDSASEGSNEVKHWIKTNLSVEEKCNNLQKDCMNAPLHCFGVHDNCAEYFCSKSTTPQARELVTALKNHGLFLPVLNLCQRYFANNVKSLLAGYESNAAKNYNSLIAKYTGGKRVFNALARSYKGRTAQAAVQYNSEGQSISSFQKFKYDNPQKACVKLEALRKRKNLHNAVREAVKPKKRKNDESRGNNNQKKRQYGEGREDLDFTSAQMETAKTNFIQQLDEDKQNRDSIQIQTKGQRFNSRWSEIRQNLLTSSYFGRILNVRNRKSYTNIVDDILYHNNQYSNAAEIVHQHLHEMDALKIFSNTHRSESIDTCGIFIDADHSFLGASPFRLCGEEGLLMVQCPQKLYKKGIVDSLNKKLIPFWKIVDGEIRVNTKSHWYIELQGQLHISNKKYGYLVVYLDETEYKIEKVTRDDDFWNSEMKDELIFFFKEAMVKELVNPRDERNMEQRKYDEVSKTFV